MLLQFKEELAKEYKSNSQKIRVMSENWVKCNIYCPKCGSKLIQHKNNKPVDDFYCENCKEEFELKSSQKPVNKLMGGEYSTMVKKVINNNLPNFLLLNYNSKFEIVDIKIIPKHYFTMDIIEARNKLQPTARRAGWQGCYINISNIPESGEIYIIKNSVFLEKEKVIEKFTKTLFLLNCKDQEVKGWTLDVMKCIDALNKEEFVLGDLYACEIELCKKYPDNKHIRDKIRQQLQILRDNNYLEFTGRGKYKLK